jgi:hypothetical protein
MYITPGISKESAQSIFSQRKSFLSKRFGKKKHAPPKRVELLYLPFYLFEVVSSSEERKHGVKVCLDGLLGENLFFFRENMAYKDRVDKPVCPFVLSPAAARQKAADKYKWLQLEHKLRIKQEFEIGEISEGKRIFYPFWVGYFQKGGGTPNPFTVSQMPFFRDVISKVCRKNKDPQGISQKGNNYDFKIMDAVSGEVQGVRMRKVFLKALRLLD